jgi:predicted ribosome-associated RNA-binding protein Tma20
MVRGSSLFIDVNSDTEPAIGLVTDQTQPHLMVAADFPIIATSRIHSGARIFIPGAVRAQKPIQCISFTLSQPLSDRICTAMNIKSAALATIIYDAHLVGEQTVNGEIPKVKFSLFS